MKMFRYLFIVSLVIFSGDAMNINEFFPNIKGNLTKITWAHAVNNLTYLMSSLNSSEVMMLEADVVYGQLNGNGANLPIMGHPPVTTSDLSLEMFLNFTINHNFNATSALKKGIKLDFKTTEVFERSIDVLTNLTNLNCPLWINADIVRGPVNASAPNVDAGVFLPRAKNFNDSALSLGWTTTRSTNTSSYTNEQIDEMIKLIQKYNISQEITFPVRAGTAALSITQMKKLKSEVKGSTLTFWQSNDNDEVNITKFREVIFDWGVDKVFIDVPKSLLDKLHLNETKINSGNLLTVGFATIFITFIAVFVNLFK